MWKEIRHPKTRRLMFRFDSDRQLAEVSDGGEKVLVDLRDTEALPHNKVQEPKPMIQPAR